MSHNKDSDIDTNTRLSMNFRKSNTRGTARRQKDIENNNKQLSLINQYSLNYHKDLSNSCNSFNDDKFKYNNNISSKLKTHFKSKNKNITFVFNFDKIERSIDKMIDDFLNKINGSNEISYNYKRVGGVLDLIQLIKEYPNKFSFFDYMNPPSKVLKHTLKNKLSDNVENINISEKNYALISYYQKRNNFFFNTLFDFIKYNNNSMNAMQYHIDKFVQLNNENLVEIDIETDYFFLISLRNKNIESKAEELLHSNISYLKKIFKDYKEINPISVFLNIRLFYCNEKYVSFYNSSLEEIWLIRKIIKSTIQRGFFEGLEYLFSLRNDIYLYLIEGDIWKKVILNFDEIDTNNLWIMYEEQLHNHKNIMTSQKTDMLKNELSYFKIDIEFSYYVPTLFLSNDKDHAIGLSNEINKFYREKTTGKKVNLDNARRFEELESELMLEPISNFNCLLNICFKYSRVEHVYFLICKYFSIKGNIGQDIFEICIENNEDISINILDKVINSENAKETYMKTALLKKYYRLAMKLVNIPQCKRYLFTPPPKDERYFELIQEIALGQKKIKNELLIIEKNKANKNENLQLCSYRTDISQAISKSIEDSEINDNYNKLISKKSSLSNNNQNMLNIKNNIKNINLDCLASSNNAFISQTFRNKNLKSASVLSKISNNLNNSQLTNQAKTQKPNINYENNANLDTNNNINNKNNELLSNINYSNNNSLSSRFNDNNYLNLDNLNYDDIKLKDTYKTNNRFEITKEDNNIFQFNNCVNNPIKILANSKISSPSIKNIIKEKQNTNSLNVSYLDLNNSEKKIDNPNINNNNSKSNDIKNHKLTLLNNNKSAEDNFIIDNSNQIEIDFRNIIDETLKLKKQTFKEKDLISNRKKLQKINDPEINLKSDTSLKNLKTNKIKDKDVNNVSITDKSLSRNTSIKTSIKKNGNNYDIKNNITSNYQIKNNDCILNVQYMLIDSIKFGKYVFYCVNLLSVIPDSYLNTDLSDNLCKSFLTLSRDEEEISKTRYPLLVCTLSAELLFRYGRLNAKFAYKCQSVAEIFLSLGENLQNAMKEEETLNFFLKEQFDINNRCALEIIAENRYYNLLNNENVASIVNKLWYGSGKNISMFKYCRITRLIWYTNIKHQSYNEAIKRYTYEDNSQPLKIIGFDNNEDIINKSDNSSNTMYKYSNTFTFQYSEYINNCSVRYIIDSLSTLMSTILFQIVIYLYVEKKKEYVIEAVLYYKSNIEYVTDIDNIKNAINTKEDPFLDYDFFNKNIIASIIVYSNILQVVLFFIYLKKTNRKIKINATSLIDILTLIAVTLNLLNIKKILIPIIENLLNLSNFTSNVSLLVNIEENQYNLGHLIDTILFSIIIICAWARVIMILVTTRAFGPFIRIVYLIFKTMLNFIIIFSCFNTVSAQIFTMYFYKSNYSFNEFFKSWIELFNNSLGVNNFGSFKSDIIFGDSILLCYTTISNVMMFNLIVSIVDNLYQNYQSQADSENRAVLVLTYERIKWDSKYGLLILFPAPFNLISFPLCIILLIINSHYSLKLGKDNYISNNLINTYNKTNNHLNNHSDVYDINNNLKQNKKTKILYEFDKKKVYFNNLFSKIAYISIALVNFFLMFILGVLGLPIAYIVSIFYSIYDNYKSFGFEDICKGFLEIFIRPLKLIYYLIQDLIGFWKICYLNNNDYLKSKEDQLSSISKPIIDLIRKTLVEFKTTTKKKKLTIYDIFKQLNLLDELHKIENKLTINNNINTNNDYTYKNATTKISSNFVSDNKKTNNNNSNNNNDNNENNIKNNFSCINNSPNIYDRSDIKFFNQNNSNIILHQPSSNLILENNKYNYSIKKSSNFESVSSIGLIKKGLRNKFPSIFSTRFINSSFNGLKNNNLITNLKNILKENNPICNSNVTQLNINDNYNGLPPNSNAFNSQFINSISEYNHNQYDLITTNYLNSRKLNLDKFNLIKSLNSILLKICDKDKYVDIDRALVLLPPRVMLSSNYIRTMKYLNIKFILKGLRVFFFDNALNNPVYSYKKLQQLLIKLTVKLKIIQTFISDDSFEALKQSFNKINNNEIYFKNYENIKRMEELDEISDYEDEEESNNINSFNN